MHRAPARLDQRRDCTGEYVKNNETLYRDGEEAIDSYYPNGSDISRTKLSWQGRVCRVDVRTRQVLCSAAILAHGHAHEYNQVKL